MTAKKTSDKAEAQPSTSSSTAGSHDVNSSNTEEMDSIATKITEMDESILSYFKDQLPHKRPLFPEGTIGVFPRQGTSKSPRKESENEESEVCHVCGLQSPAKKKTWSRHWIACDTCKSWPHLECSKCQRLPTNDEPFQCTSCDKSSKQ